jgi:hypothetical protein
MNDLARRKSITLKEHISIISQGPEKNPPALGRF